MLTIYHNKRCSKSREGVCFLENLNKPFETIHYLEKTLTYIELETIIKKLRSYMKKILKNASFAAKV